MGRGSYIALSYDAYSHFSILLRHPVTILAFVELGGGVDDVPVWCRDGAYVYAIVPLNIKRESYICVT